MTCSPARLIANQANAQRSTGPRTAEGKVRSRANSLKHGMTGAGVVVAEDDAAEVANRFEQLQGELQPSSPLGRIMVHRVAFLSVRLERSGEQELASVAKSVRHAQDDYDDQRTAEVEALMDSLGETPTASVRRLLRSPEGIDALCQAWADLRDELGRSNARFWTAAHCERANNLAGRRMDQIPISEFNVLSHAIWGDFGLLEDHEGADLDDMARKTWARERLVALIDEELVALRECRGCVDLDAFELDRDEAGQRALFDLSKQASLARRYEAAAERGMYRALKEFRRLEAEAGGHAESNPGAHSEPAGQHPEESLGSFRNDDEPDFEEDLEAELEIEEARVARTERDSTPIGEDDSPVSDHFRAIPEPYFVGN